MGNESNATQINLFDEFPPVSREAWEKAIANDLNGADYRKRLKWETGEGVEVLPFYRRDDLQSLEHTGPVPADKEKNEWEVRQPIYDSDLSSARKTIDSALERGADALQLKIRIHKTDGMLGGDIEGTAIQGQNEFDTLFGHLPLERTALHFDASMASPLLIAMLYNLAEKRELDRDKIGATFLYDPYAYTITSGQVPKPEADFLDEARQLVEFTGSRLPLARCLGVDTRPYHNSGATIVQELAFALSTGSEYLAKLTDKGLAPGQIASQIHFSLSIGSNYFLEIAKFRALRLLWQKIGEAYIPEKKSAESFRAYIHGETSEWNKTLYDPYTNMLRSTTEGMSAAIAGCDAITIHPFDHIFEQPEDFGRRIARNAQIIFSEEARLNQVFDPGAGSYYIEMLTDRIAGQSWKLFQEIEKQGGMMAAVANRSITTMIASAAEERERAVAERKRIFVGTNQYPNAGERRGDAIDFDGRFQVTSLLESEKDLKFTVDRDRIVESLAEALGKGALFGDIVPELFDPGKQLFRPIQPGRATEKLEELRLATERRGDPPSVFLVPMGDRKRRRARSTFAGNFLGCAGYEITDHIGFDSVDDAVDGIRKAAPDIVVLCSSDPEYKELVKPFCSRMASLDNEPLVLLAGYPDDEEEADRYRKAGIDMFIHSRSNLPDRLKELHRKMGILNR